MDHPEEYTGHCFRRTGTTLLSNSGAPMIIKQLGGWKSDTVAQLYVADSLENKNKIYDGITHEASRNIQLNSAKLINYCKIVI